MSEAAPEFLDTVAGESAFFRALCDIRPVGLHREFHMMAVAQHIQSATGTYVPIEELWTKFRGCYEEDILESFEKPGYHTGSGSPSSSDSEDKDVEMDDEEGGENDNDGKKRGNFKSKNSPRVGEDLDRHPFFRKEFELPTGSGWPLYFTPTSAVASNIAAGGIGKRETGHMRKESTVTTTGRSTRAAGRSSATAKAATAPVEESDSDLTSEGNGDEVDGDGDGDEEDRAESEGRGTTRAGTRSVVDADEQPGGATRRSTRQTRTTAKETGGTAKTTTKKKRG
ncbi:hypothetical protein FRC17_005014 [Serendipita sp. 399]|nr:hypothetical protein FRC17_005014 [Serendipita sp. 399]